MGFGYLAEADWDVPTLLTIEERSLKYQLSKYAIGSRPSVTLKTPAFASIKITCQGCKQFCGVNEMGVPIDRLVISSDSEFNSGFSLFGVTIGSGQTLSSMYNQFRNLKPRPMLKSISITTMGQSTGFMSEIKGQVECFTREDFQRVEGFLCVFLNEVDVEFGYGPKHGLKLTEIQKVSQVGYLIRSFSFSTTEKGSWVIDFTAMGPRAEAEFDMNTPLDGTGLLTKSTTQGSRDPGSVFDFLELDTMINGISSIDSAITGDISITKFVGYVPIPPTPREIPSPDSKVPDVIRDFTFAAIYEAQRTAMFTYTVSSMGACIYSPDFVNVGKSKLSTDGNSKEKIEPRTQNFQYFTLGYIVERLINSSIRETKKKYSVQKDTKQIQDFNIFFDPNISISEVPISSRSGKPTSILLLGMGSGIYINTKLVGKDFESKVNPLLRCLSKSPDGPTTYKVELSKILVEKSVIDKAREKSSGREDQPTDPESMNSFPEMSVKPVDFLRKIFEEIEICTGGLLKLGLYPDSRDPFEQTYVIVDQTYDRPNLGKGKTCVVLDPINGDGITRSCQISAGSGGEKLKNVGATTVMQSVTNILSSDGRGCTEELKVRQASVFPDVIRKINETIISPGELPSDGFSEESCNKLISLLSLLKSADTNFDQYKIAIHPSLKISANLDGIWGISLYYYISSTQLPDRYFYPNGRFSNIYRAAFQITNVTHTLNNNDWSTQIEGFFRKIENSDYFKFLNYNPSPL